MNQNNVSKTLFLLDSNIDKKKLNSYDLESSTIIVFDYSIHKFLNEKKIQHKIADDYLDDNERTELFKLTSNYLQKYEKISDSGISFHEIDLLTIVDRNELLEFLMQILPKIQIIKKILEQDTYKKIFATSEIYEIFVNTKFSSHFERLTYVDQNPLTFENIQIPFKFGNQEIKFSINRKKYKILKQNVEKISGALFNLKNNMEEKNKIILLEFDPQIYFELLKQIDASGYQPVLINFRKSPTYSMGAIKNLKQSNSLIITPENFLENDDFEEISHAKISISKILKEILKNTEHFPNLISKETNFDLLLKNKIINIILQRLDEYLLQILIAEKIKKMNNVKCIIGLNFSGETEKIFSRLNEKIPILLLQHAFANYLQSISHFDILDDYHLIQDKIAVWGDIVKNYLINVRKIPENKIIVSGSPKCLIIKK